jgi:hypothetical protein
MRIDQRRRRKAKPNWTGYVAGTTHKVETRMDSNQHQGQQAPGREGGSRVILAIVAAPQGSR